MKRIILVLAAIISLFASLSLAEEEYISISSDTLVYYAEDETHYHLDPGCCIMPGESLRSNSFTYAERDTNAYRDMLPCEICTAPLIQSKKPHFSTFEEAIDNCMDACFEHSFWRTSASCARMVTWGSTCVRLARARGLAR